MAAQTIPTLDVQSRENVGTRDARRLRNDGRLPIVIYGHGQDPVHVSSDAKALFDILHDGAHLLQLQIEGQTQACLVKQVQWDTYGRNIVHVDLTRVDLSEKVTVELEVHLTGEPIGLKEAGHMLQHPTTMVEIACRADSIPDHLRLDIADLAAGDSRSAGDIPLPEGVELVTDPSAIVATITVAAAEPEEQEETEAGEGEPEVIGRDEDEDEAENA